MKKLVTKEIKFDTIEGQVRFLMNKEFSRIPNHLLLNEDFYSNVSYLYPSEEYQEMQALTEGMSLDDFQERLWDDYSINGDLYLCDDYYIDNGIICNPDILYELGFAALEYNDEYFLYSIGYGFDTTKRFADLFEHLGFIKYEEVEEESI